MLKRFNSNGFVLNGENKRKRTADLLNAIAFYEVTA